MDDNMKATLCCNTIDNAYKETRAKEGVIIYRDAGKCFDNAREENFLGALKKEKFI